MMKSINIFLAVCCTMLAGSVYAANETPMQLFKELRNAAINNDTAAALGLTGGEILKKIENEGIFPKDLRLTLIFVSAAFEDIHVRLANPDQAELHAFYKKNGILEYLNVKLKQNENAVMKIISIDKQQYLPQPFMDKFLAACQANAIARYRDLITPELAEKHALIPDNLKNSASVTPGKSTGSSASFVLDINGIKGNIKMIRDGYFWKISAIDAILTAPSPARKVEDFCNAVKAGTEPANLQKFLSNSVAEQIKADDLNLFMGFASIVSQSALPSNKFKIDIKVNSDDETGIISLEMGFKETDWEITRYNMGLIYKREFAPAVVMEKFIETAVKNKDFDSDAAKELIPDNIREQLKKDITEASPDLTFTIEEEKILSSQTDISATIQNSKFAENIKAAMTLKDGKWFIKNITITPPKPETEEGAEEKAQEGSEGKTDPAE